MRLARLWSRHFVVGVGLLGFSLAACSESDSESGKESEVETGAGVPDEFGAAEGGASSGNASGDSQFPVERDCGDSVCGPDELCVETQGALCMPLPPEGQSCQEGCVLTEHCCNCSAFSCTGFPDECEDGASCTCLRDAQERGYLSGCPIERSECDGGGGELLCIQVALDEDPFE